MNKSRKVTGQKSKKRKIRLWAVILWLLLWELLSRVIGNDILLVSPAEVLSTLGTLVTQGEFWTSSLFTVTRIMGGFILALAAGTGAAVLSCVSVRFREFLEPLVRTVMAIPVASFVILVLIWISSENLSVVIAFLMVFPVIYTNMYTGIAETDVRLLEVAGLFSMSRKDRVRYIYFSQVIPYFRSACSVSLGICWKAGVAAEVIGLPEGSIGENLYNAKVFFDTPYLFAWTVVIICISILFEKIFMAAVDGVIRKTEKAL